MFRCVKKCSNQLSHTGQGLPSFLTASQPWISCFLPVNFRQSATVVPALCLNMTRSSIVYSLSYLKLPFSKQKLEFNLKIQADLHHSFAQHSLLWIFISSRIKCKLFSMAYKALYDLALGRSAWTSTSKFSHCSFFSTTQVFLNMPSLILPQGLLSSLCLECSIPRSLHGSLLTLCLLSHFYCLQRTVLIAIS